MENSQKDISYTLTHLHFHLTKKTFTPTEKYMAELEKQIVAPIIEPEDPSLLKVLNQVDDIQWWQFELEMRLQCLFLGSPNFYFSIEMLS